MDKLINTLPAILRASNNAEEVSEAACIAAWKHAIGEGLRTIALPVRFSVDTLVVAVEHEAVKTQLDRMRGQLLFRLNSVLGQPLVKSIDIRLDPSAFAAKVSEAKSAGGNRDAIPVDLLYAASAIEDTELRNAFLGAATSCVNRLEKSQSETTNSKA